MTPDRCGGAPTTDAGLTYDLAPMIGTLTNHTVRIEVELARPERYDTDSQIVASGSPQQSFILRPPLLLKSLDILNTAHKSVAPLYPIHIRAN